MSFISELERLKEMATKGVIGKRDVGNYLINHADEIAELVKAADAIAENEPLNEAYRMRVLRDAIAALNKEKP